MKTYTIEDLRRKATAAPVKSFLDWLEVQSPNEESTWGCPHCGKSYDLIKLVDFDNMDKCCQYYMGREAFHLYQQKHATRA